MGEDDFLMRIFDLTNMRSTDHRYDDAAGDICQHRVRNYDWDDDWIFSDARFNLLRCPDEQFLAFLSEMLHPVVQDDEEWVEWLLDMFNRHLLVDGWDIAPVSEISDRPIFAGRRLLTGASQAVKNAREATKILDTAYISKQISRMDKAVVGDPELAIGTAKEFVETICKTILDECNVSIEKGVDLPKLTKQVMRLLELAPDQLPAASKANDTLKRLLSNLATVSQGVAELRNIAGSGHGKSAKTQVLEHRHARLAVSAAIALGVFLFETYEDQYERTCS